MSSRLRFGPQQVPASSPRSYAGISRQSLAALRSTMLLASPQYRCTQLGCIAAFSTTRMSGPTTSCRHLKPFRRLMAVNAAVAKSSVSSIHCRDWCRAISIPTAVELAYQQLVLSGCAYSPAPNAEEILHGACFYVIPLKIAFSHRPVPSLCRGTRATLPNLLPGKYS